MDFKGTQSEKNIQSALMGESVARNKYTYYAEKAKAEGREDISTLFEAMAKNEANHAKIWFKLLHGDIADTKSNPLLEKTLNGLLCILNLLKLHMQKVLNN